MNEKRTTVFENGLIWFGAALSIAEIMTGTYFAPLGLKQGLLAVIVGHIIGCIMLFLAGLIGAKTDKNSMETVKSSFGCIGARFFALINVVQLIGWTAIMIYDGALAANGIFNIGSPLWCVVIGGFIILWVVIGIKNLGKINTVAMLALLVLTIVLSCIIFVDDSIRDFSSEGITFGAAVELSVAMPLSWLPLISDYTKEAEKPLKSTAVSVIIYGIVSSWMYIIGMCAAIFTGETDIAQIMVSSGLGVAGLIIIVFSTVTTTFLDAYSAGVSAETICAGLNSKWFAVVVTVIGIAGAMFFPLTDITDFLYFIGSVFAPMIAIQVADYYLLKRSTEHQKISGRNIIIWFVGFVVYRLLMNVDVIVGSTFPAVIITILVCIFVNVVQRYIQGGKV